MGKVHAFPGAEIPKECQDHAEAVPEVLEALKQLTAQAESGQLRMLAVAYVNLDGSTSEGWAGTGNYHLISAAISYLMGRFTNYMLDVSSKPDLPDATG